VWRRTVVWLAAAVVAVVPGCAGGGSERSSDRIVVAAASDLRVAFDDLARRFTEVSGVEVAVTYGASGQLATQIEAGAPFDVFASADEAYARRMVELGRADEASFVRYATGRLVIVGLGPDATLGDLAGPGVTRIAIANPEYAPYGRAAAEAMRNAAVWEDLGGRVVQGANVADALRLVTTGEVDAAVVARSLVDADTPGGWAPVPDGLAAPLVQALVVTSPDDAANHGAAEAFARFVQSPSGRAVLERVGFGAPP
jgi:molybdate transport system substrate-binding protein